MITDGLVRNLEVSEGEIFANEEYAEAGDPVNSRFDFGCYRLQSDEKIIRKLPALSPSRC